MLWESDRGLGSAREKDELIQGESPFRTRRIRLLQGNQLENRLSGKESSGEHRSD